MTKSSVTVRPERGRALFYSRDSGGQHETTPGQYVGWAKREAEAIGLQFDGTAARIDELIKSNRPQLGDLFFDNCVAGNILSRTALDLMKREIDHDRTISHVFIPRRDRLARPDAAVEGLLLENELRSAGITLVFTDTTVLPLKRGQRQDIGDALSAYIAYENSGKFRAEHAEKMILAQLRLAALGYSTGGRPPYGFRRFLVRIDGTVIRQLAEGEIVRQRAHHVVWLPGPEDELAIIRRILKLIVRTPATQIARLFNEERIPSPDSGRQRTDNGVKHLVSGLWHPTTIIAIARNPLLRAITKYGRRSMGDQRRMTPTGPRTVGDSDFREDNRPKVVQNPTSQHVVGKAHGPSLISDDEAARVDEILDRRGQSQRGKPRSRKPDLNPLGARVFDMNCGWPMNREPYSGSFRYTCGFYHQSHGQSCTHNCIDGIAATKFALATIRQKVVSVATRGRIEERIRQRLEHLSSEDQPTGNSLATKEAELQCAKSDLTTATRNLALARPETFAAVQDVVIDLQKRVTTLEQEIEVVRHETTIKSPMPSLAAGAIHLLNELPMLADDSKNLARLADLFKATNLQLFLRFQAVQQKKRFVNRVSGGVITMGSVPDPVKKYTGPTGRRAFRKNPPEASLPVDSNDPQRAVSSDPEVESLRNVSRGSRTPVELFLADVAGWEPHIIRQVQAA